MISGMTSADLLHHVTLSISNRKELSRQIKLLTMRLKKISLFVLMVIMITGTAFAGLKPLVKVGDWYFKQFDFKTAVKYYLEAKKKGSDDAYLKQRLGDSYRLLNDWTNAEPYYQALSQDGSANNINKLYYAQALWANQKYSDALIALKGYSEAVPTDKSYKDMLNSLDQVNSLSKDNGMYTLELMSINSAASDFGPTLYRDTGIIFCSNRQPDAYVKERDSWTNAPFLQIYQAFKDSSGMITSAKPIDSKAVNKKFHEGTSSYSEKMQELYFDRSNYNGKKVKLAADKTNKLKIFRLVWLPDQVRWGDEVIEAVPFNDKEYSVCHPALSKDGKTLFFSSDKPGGYGGMDLYTTTREIGGQWGTPVNLGPTVNTSANEMFPFLADDGTLYLASNGHLGLGGLDVFSTQRVGKASWQTPENLGYPINTNSDDFGYIIDKDNKKGYIVSNRPGGMGDDDIYSFTKKGAMVDVIVYDARTEKVIEGAKVVMFEGTAEKANKLTDKDGKSTFAASPKKVYKFTASKDGYLPNEQTVEIKEKQAPIRIPLVRTEGINLEVTVLDKRTRDPLSEAKVKLVNLTSNKEENCTTNQDGKCMFSLDPNTNYRIEGSKDLGDPETKYLTVTSTLSTQGKEAPATLYAVLELEKVKKGIAIKIENIYYDLDKWYIRPDAAKELDKLVKVLQDNPTMEIELSSHTDCRATAKYNMELSTKRAQSAVAYIATQGVDPKRMIAAGYGETRLLNKCSCEGTVIVPCTEDEHQLNRRTEFKILKF
jgi:outer membrane protein OmpA-like peptidoglycan-associated protein/tetratricopeptide (TPR) repeat protein